MGRVGKLAFKISSHFTSCFAGVDCTNKIFSSFGRGLVLNDTLARPDLLPLSPDQFFSGKNARQRQGIIKN
jgi:hypothetical protein